MKSELTKFLDENSYSYNTWENDDETIITVKVSKNDTDKKVGTVYTNIKDLRAATKMTQQSFGDYFGISIRNIQDWEANAHSCKPYLINLMEFKLRKNEVIK